jgi:3-oxoacyl-[acyl-carrier protein] reductase
MSTPVAPSPRLERRRVVVAGGTGSVGEGIVRAWLRAGAHVVVLTRTPQRAEEFRRVLGAEGETERLTLVVGNYTTFDGAKELADQIEGEHGPVSDAVASIGGWWAGPTVWNTSQHAWDEYFAGYATAHLAVARTFIPRFTPEGSYHVIVGGSAIFPVPGSGIVSMQQAALLMMGRVLQAETQGQRRVFTELLGPVNTRSRPQHRPDFISNEDVGLLTTTLSADAKAASANHELLDKAAFERVLGGAQERGGHR